MIRVGLNTKNMLKFMLFSIGTDAKRTTVDFHHNNHGFSE